ncbi:MAG: SDR family oxidoreductase [Bacteroidales bacterium]|nr:SDR family oxidoreductase [Bacteroidales bacterium]
MLSKTENSYILVSAATSDIGFAIVRRIASTNNVVLHGRDPEKLTSLMARIETGHKITLWCYDLKNVEGIQESLKKLLVENDITISGFVHCAATLRILPLKNFRLEYSREIFDVNFFSAAEIVKTLLLKVNKQELNSVVMISALFSKFGSKGNSMYAASKGAIDSFVKSMAVELAPGVRVNSVLPGGLRTAMTAHLFDSEDYLKAFREKYLLGEGECDDVAAMVSFLLSEDAKWITGQHLTVDGGASCH